MRIGIDIDGVLTNLEDFQLSYGTKYCVEINKDYKIFPKEYRIKDIFKFNEEERTKFWNEYLICMVNQPVRAFSSEIITKLKEEKNEIYIITARNNDGFENTKYNGKMKELVENWLYENNIYYDKIIYTIGDKARYCTKEKIDVLVEDKPSNVESVSKIIPVICFNSKYNEHIKSDNIKRAYSWYDVYRIISNMKRKDNLWINKNI